MNAKTGKHAIAAAAAALALASGGACLLSGCAGQSEKATETNTVSDTSQNTQNQADTTEQTPSGIPTKESLVLAETISNSTGGEHAIEADATTESHSAIGVEKTGDSSQGDEADFYGDNAAIFATNGATLDLDGILVESAGTHANAVFSYGKGTTVNISDSVIETSGDCSGGLMTTGGGTMNASNLSISTSGRSSAAIRSDRGGGDVNVTGGLYKTSGMGSPVIYSTADIEVRDATMQSFSSQGVVVEGKNSVKLADCALTADNNTKNSDKSDYYQAVMVYQSMSGDADSGEASFEMEGGSLTNKNGDVFFVTNTVASIELDHAVIVNEDADGVFLRAAAAGWGSEGGNGGQVDLDASAQNIDGDIVVDSVSNLNLKLSGGSVFTGAVNSEGAAGEVYVELDSTSKWVLTADSHITSLTCSAGSIDLNGHTLYVGDGAYDGADSTGSAIEHTVSTGGAGMGTPPDKPGDNASGKESPGDGEQPPEMPNDGGQPPEMTGDGTTPPDRPDGNTAKPGDGNQPPAKPGEDGSSAGKPGDGSQPPTQKNGRSEQVPQSSGANGPSQANS